MIPLVAPFITKIDRAAMITAAADGTMYDEQTVRAFEEAFAARVGCDWAVAVNSGTSALIVALVARGFNGAPVRIPSYGCIALAHARDEVGGAWSGTLVDTAFDVATAQADHAGDVDVVVHLFGRPTLASGEIEDYTLSLGGVERLGGRIGVCSTHASKMLSTGRGGLVFGNGIAQLARVEELVHYERHTLFGYSVAMSSMQAALGLSQLGQLDSFIARRRELAACYTERFRGAGIESPDPDCGSVFFRYLIGVASPAEAVQGLAERGIEAGRGVYPPLHRLAGLPDDNFPGTTAAVNSLLSVPVHPSITDEQADHIIESVLAVCAP